MKIRNIRIGQQIYSEILFMIFFCYNVFASVVEEIFGSAAITPLYYLIFFTLLLFAIIVEKEKWSLVVPFFVYFTVYLLFFFTALVHPEYNEWFSHPVYGIVPALMSPQSGIWALLIVWLVKDDSELYTVLKYTSWILFVFHTLQFVLASVRGYWIIWDIDDTLRQDSYSLEFGYNMLLPVAFFGSECFLQSKKSYFIPYILGTIIIFSGGSRGAAIWPVIMFLFLLPFEWNNIKGKKRTRFVLALIVLLIAVALIYMNYQTILLGLSTILSRYGISSRTLSSLIEGSFADGNGREQIYSMAIDLIKTGGLFGHGVYGDRYTIGNYFRWGYSHNIFIELFVSFGYLGGTVTCIYLIIGTLKLYKHCNTLERQIVFITFLTTSCKLMLSNSFWYTAEFWALLALMIRWAGKHRVRFQVA